MEQKEILEAGALAIRNIGVIEQAYHLIEEKIQTTMGVEVENAVKARLSDESWRIDMLSDANELNDESWIAPNQWQQNEKDDEWFAWFYIWKEFPENNNDAWNLTQMCGQGEAEVGFKWKVHHKLLGKNMRQWKEYTLLQVEDYPKLGELGFKYTEGSWFLPMRIESNKLADAWANDEMDDVLAEMVGKCMDNISEAVPEFDAILKQVQEI